MRKFSGSAPFDDFGAVTKKVEDENQTIAVIQTVIFIITNNKQKSCDPKREFKIYELNIRVIIVRLQLYMLWHSKISSKTKLKLGDVENPLRNRITLITTMIKYHINAIYLHCLMFACAFLSRVN